MDAVDVPRDPWSGLPGVASRRWVDESGEALMPSVEAASPAVVEAVLASIGDTGPWPSPLLQADPPASQRHTCTKPAPDLAGESARCNAAASGRGTRACASGPADQTTWPGSRRARQCHTLRQRQRQPVGFGLLCQLHADEAISLDDDAPIDGPDEVRTFGLVRPFPRALEVLQPGDRPIGVDAGRCRRLLVQLVDEAVDAIVFPKVGVCGDPTSRVSCRLAG